MKTAAIHTLGCKVNTYDSEAIMELLEKEDYKIVDFKDKADVYVINTCTVTNLGDRKSRQMIRKAKRNNPDSFIVVCGCYAQTASEQLEVMPEVDLIIGNDDRNKIIEYIESAKEKGQKINAVKNIMALKEYEELKIDEISGRERGFIKIQEGCDQFCAYCIIPYARGPVRSRKPENIIDEAKRMVSKGNKELVLTGINISKYGKDLEKTSLLELLTQLNSISGLKRMRISSLEPNLLTKEFVEATSKLEKICPHFHISMQSGAAKTLKDMKRKYTKEDFFDVVNSIRKYFPDASITTDVMVGFPGETEEDFQETVEYVKKVAFSALHVFKYSKREGTPAAKYENQIPERIKEERSRILIKAGEEMKTHYERSFIGSTMSVLFEQEADESASYQGHTNNYLTVKVKSDFDLKSKILDVKITGAQNGFLTGELANI
ncbi:tRNA (N(6)-L-threonylcarbamoyladenosine(37)-C(2))-methylthiotransferase MtaB [Alkalibacter saccharofermentans]|uniref:Threonylcarbamoyladenosine tRNA methylthiotransferase MtaB n=1 Tax=Alkalibacter saccharofermentans DSM 14828 TaxID=1120975 RepID=A0A1M4XF15_9FIRM|nr:tRNA (N(6)-L-threonylcarbamoyladenosine(37)-C(2))-methylthiotransferase MtaB [Alkalibacter saccharofermentans]SHE92207.1 threonylcarbamoyladenosine tRNA methylthiotransferase MtaB [Alkalibacter saccharofermentans DSM 14828]